MGSDFFFRTNRLPLASGERTRLAPAELPQVGNEARVGRLSGAMCCSPYLFHTSDNSLSQNIDHEVFY